MEKVEEKRAAEIYPKFEKLAWQPILHVIEERKVSIIPMVIFVLQHTIIG
jgi:hypothetical protein